MLLVRLTLQSLANRWLTALLTVTASRDRPCDPRCCARRPGTDVLGW